VQGRKTRISSTRGPFTSHSETYFLGQRRLLSKQTLVWGKPGPCKWVWRSSCLRSSSPYRFLALRRHLATPKVITLCHSSG